MAEVRITVLGPLEVRGDDGVPVPVPGAKERLLLAVLTAGMPGVVPTDRIADVLWDGAPPPTARKSLQAHVVRLRSALEPGRPRGSPGRYVARRGPGYALTVDRADVDALHVGDLAAHGRAHLASGAPAEAAREFSAALDLWRGDPYADWPDAGFAEGERRRLAEVRTGALAGLCEARLALGRHAEVLPEAERLVAEEPLREDWWRLLVLTLYRSGRQADALAAVRRVRALLAEELGVSPGPALRTLEAAVLAQDPALDAPAGPAVALGVPAAVVGCPYKGLAAYRAEDAPLFHGRRRLVAGLVARLVDAPLVVVSGPSGAGKSSAVRAGLVPALAGGALPGSGSWRPVVVTPGLRPVDVLAPLTEDDGPVLLVVDQAEELWAPGTDAAERTAFLDALLGLLDDGVAARCVLVLRGDSVGRLAEHAAVSARLDGRVVLVPALTDPELREVVCEPATAAGLAVEPDLVEAVAADVLGRPSALPLLSTALVGTWERRQGDTLTLAGYLAAGGVAGALTRTAEAAWAVLDARGQELARRLLVRLADVDDAGALVRRPLPRGDVDTGDPARREVVDVFVTRRLLSVDGDRLDVAHEALLTAWPRLARWLEEDAAGRAVRRHLAPAARDWDAAGRPDDELYRGARLTAALDWAAGADDELTPIERDFLDASRAHAERDLEQAREQARREGRRRRRTRRLAVGLAAALAVALVAGSLTLRAQQEAARTSLVADANRLAALSATAGRLDVAFLLAAQAVQLADTPESQDALLTALLAHPRAVRAVPLPGRVRAGVLAGGGRSLFLGVGTELVTWEVGPTSLPRAVLGLGEWIGWRAAAASPVDDVIVGFGAAEEGPWVRRADVTGADQPLLHGEEVGGNPVAGSFAADGRQVRLLVVSEADGGGAPTAGWAVTVLDPEAGTRLESRPGGSLPVPPDQVLGHVADDDPATGVLWAMDEPSASLVDLDDASAVPVQWQEREASTTAFRALASGAAQFWDDGAVTLYDRAGRPVQLLTGHQRTVRDVVVSPDGRWAATVGDGAAVVVWDVDPSTGRWTRHESLPGHDADVVEAAVDGTGSRLFTASVDDTVIEWDMTADGGFGGTYPPLSDRYVSNRPQLVEPGGLLVAPTRAVGADPGVGEDPIDRLAPRPDTRSVAATFLDPATGEVTDQVVVGDTLEGASFGSSVAVSPDGRAVAVTSGLRTTVLDTRTRDVLTRIELEPTGDTDRQGEPLTAEPVWCAGWTPDGSRLLLCAEGRLADPRDGGLVVHDVDTWQPVDRLGIGAPQSVEASPDGRRLAVALSGTAEVVVLDARTLEVERTVPLAEDDRLYDLSFSPDGRQLAAGGELGLVHVLDTGSWEWAGDPANVHDDAVLQVEWLPDDRTVVTAGADGRVSLFDTARRLVRARPLPASAESGEGLAHVVPGPGLELVALGGERPGRRYPLDPSAWLDRACAVVGRDLTEAEWERYVPGREREPTCTDA